MFKKWAATLSSGINHLSVAFIAHSKSKFLVIINIIVIITKLCRT